MISLRFTYVITYRLFAYPEICYKFDETITSPCFLLHGYLLHKYFLCRRWRFTSNYAATLYIFDVFLCNCVCFFMNCGNKSESESRPFSLTLCHCPSFRHLPYFSFLLSEHNKNSKSPPPPRQLLIIS